MFRKLSLISIGLAVFVTAFALPGLAAGPDFSNPAIYADGEAWATKGLGALPPPNGKNNQSFDGLFVIMDGHVGQLPVAEAAPGNPDYNGGRWDVYFAIWKDMPDPPLVTSYAALASYIEDGFIDIISAHTYFECPLLPLDDE